jgi:hypothetical protein
VFSIAVAPDLSAAVAVGGDYLKPGNTSGTAATVMVPRVIAPYAFAAARPPHGYRSAVAWDADAKAWLSVGTNGSDISYDDGKTWVPLDNGNWNALSLPRAVGPDERIGKLDSGKLKR